MAKRSFDFLVCLAGLAATLPLYPLIGLAIKLDSAGSIFYLQRRIGRFGRPFSIVKFRTMVRDADDPRQVTLKDDTRVTRVGRWLRRYKFDEIPTLFNVLNGDMSVVGPRPEVPRYVEQYTPEQRRVLSVRPGITDTATLKFNNEALLLTDVEHSEDIYLEKILPEKLRLNLEYVNNQNLLYDLRIIFRTLALILRERTG